MSWKKKEELLEAILKKVWQDVPSVLEAPKVDDLNFNYSEESSKLYKSINEKGIWLCQNPALIRYQMDRFESPILRMKPKWCMSLDDADKDENKYRHQSYKGELKGQSSEGVQI